MSLSPETNALLQTAFRPHAPIEDPQSFAGREKEKARVMDAIEQRGLQVVIFGERGAGKTSLANVCTVNRKRVRVFCQENSTFQSLCSDVVMEYQKVAPAAFKFDALKGTVEVKGGVLPLHQLTGNLLRQIFPDDQSVCVILDEIDRLRDKSVVREIAELAKNFSTYKQNVTLILIGVATNADELLAGHASNYRNVRQVSLDRMKGDDLRAIICRGEAVLSVAVQDKVKHRIIEICDLLPYYLHLLASSSARHALSRGSKEVTEADLSEGIKAAAADADETLRTVYEHAILSKNKTEIYRQVLWALSELTWADYSVSHIAAAATRIADAEGTNGVSDATIGRALKKLTTSGKKEILIAKSSGFYRFRNPLMKGFVRLMREQS